MKVEETKKFVLFMEEFRFEPWWLKMPRLHFHVCLSSLIRKVLCWLFGFRLLREADAALIHVGSEWEALS